MLSALDAQAPATRPWPRPLTRPAWLHNTCTQWACFLGALLVYALTRLIALEAFPIYFFCDEAIHTICFRQLAANGFHSSDGEFLPTYFRNVAKFNLSLSVYVQGLSALLFGNSVVTVRATTALLSLGAAGASAWMLKSVFCLREWWLGAMLLAVTPVWLVHSRTGFETGLMVVCYTWFLLFYCLYRAHDPRWIFPAMLAGAGTFYAYANGQGVMVASAAMLLASDARYHWHRRGWAAAGSGFAFVLFLPYLRFRHNHPDFLNEHLRDLSSFAMQDVSLWQKVMLFLGNYAQGLNPHYWFFAGQEELVRHTAPGYGHFFGWLLPFYLLGVGICLWRFRESRYRVMLVAMLAAPASAALAGIAAYRALAFIIPANAAIAFGICFVLDHVRDRRLILAVRGLVFAGLALCGFTLLANCLNDGPTYCRDYMLYGMQWGAPQLVRDTVPRLLRVYPHARIWSTTDWANGVNVYPPFFGVPESRMKFENLDVILSGAWDGCPDDLLIIPSVDLALINKCQMFAPLDVIGRVPRPDGEVGFYIGHLRWAPDAAAKLAAMHAAQSAPVTEPATINEQPVTVTHPPFEMGTVADLFDGQPYTTPRCYRGVPMVIELRLPAPRALASVSVHHRERTIFTQRVQAFAGDAEVKSQEDHGTGEMIDPVMRVDLGGQPVDRIHIEVAQGADDWVHLRDITLEDAPTR